MTDMLDLLKNRSRGTAETRGATKLPIAQEMEKRLPPSPLGDGERPPRAVILQALREARKEGKLTKSAVVKKIAALRGASE